MYMIYWDFNSVEFFKGQANVKAMVKKKTYSFWAHNYHKVIGVIKVCPDRITRTLAIKKLSSG